MGLHWWLNGKESTYNTGTTGDTVWISELRRTPGGSHGNSLPVFLSGERHGQRSLAGHSPQGCKESDTTSDSACSTHAVANTKS